MMFSKPLLKITIKHKPLKIILEHVIIKYIIIKYIIIIYPLKFVLTEQ